MGTLASNPGLVATFDGQIHKKGLQLNLCKIVQEDGTNQVDPTATIRSGSIVTKSSAHLIQPCTGLNSFGVAKWGKVTFGVSVVVDLPIVFATNTATVQLTTPTGQARGNVSNITIRSVAGMGGVVYVDPTDYTKVAPAGTVTRVNPGATPIPVGTVVYATFTYDLVDADYQFDGRKWQNQAEDATTFQEGKITVIQSWARLHTIEWVTGDGTADAANSTYSVNQKLYCSPTSKFTNDTAGGPDFQGRVFQLPNNGSVYMGITYHGDPTP